MDFKKDCWTCKGLGLGFLIQKWFIMGRSSYVRFFFLQYLYCQIHANIVFDNAARKGPCSCLLCPTYCYVKL